MVAGYGDFMILNNLSLQAKRGKITLLLGPERRGQVDRAEDAVRHAEGAPGPDHGSTARTSPAPAQKDLLAQHGVAFVPQGRNLFGQLSGLARTWSSAASRSA